MKLKSQQKGYNERGTYVCPKCGEKFRLGSTLWRHLHIDKCDELLPFKD